LVIQGFSTAVVPPSGGSSGWSFQEPAGGARTRLGVGAGTDDKVYRIEVTGYRANTVNRVSKFRRSNKVYLVPFDRLSQEYQRIHAQGGVIASITSV
jgi:phycoerythrin-associated linker protein